MPSITFILPHWMYWAGLIFVPFLGMYMVRKQRGQKVDGGMSKPVAYLLWLCGGFVGLHRFYVKNVWGMVYIPIFILLLLSNVQVRTNMNLVSKEKNDMTSAAGRVERAQRAIKKHSQAVQNYQTQAGQTQEKAAQDRINRRLKRVQKKLDREQNKLATSQQKLETAQQNLVKEKANQSKWLMITRIIAGLIALMLLVDAYLLPKLVDTCAEKEAAEGVADTEKIAMPAQPGTGDSSTLEVKNRVFYYIDQVNGYVGEFVCFWSIIAVFVYYYEVLGRYLFNSPTNWAHESMFLMFGMQYVLAAGFTNREDAHVRVDVFYRFFPDRLKGVTDVFTSVFFFIFTLALLWTCWVFAADSVKVWEVSFTEWAIQYWPVKVMMIVGAVLLLLDGITKLIKDVYVLAGKRI